MYCTSIDNCLAFSIASYEAFLCGPAYPKTGSWNATFSISLSHPVYQKVCIESSLLKLNNLYCFVLIVLYGQALQAAAHVPSRMDCAVESSNPVC